MNLIVNEDNLTDIVKKSDILMEYLQEPISIQLINNSINKVFRIKGAFEIIAKVGFTGWGRFEFETLKRLSPKYNVPKPIMYVPLQEEVDKNHKFGVLEREVGVLFYIPLEGSSLNTVPSKEHLRQAINFLKRLHQDKSLIEGPIENYQEIEVDRGIKYVSELFEGEIARELRELIKRYRDCRINFCFIHGNPRLEHFIITKNQIGMLDFEGASIGDNFKDLGIFLIELLFHDVDKEKLLKMYYAQNLREEERERLEFFELRHLLVKMKFEPSQNILKQIKQRINYGQ